MNKEYAVNQFRLHWQEYRLLIKKERTISNQVETQSVGILKQEFLAKDELAVNWSETVSVRILMQELLMKEELEETSHDSVSVD